MVKFGNEIGCGSTGIAAGIKVMTVTHGAKSAVAIPGVPALTKAFPGRGSCKRSAKQNQIVPGPILV
jgi:hypothetical protein